MELYPASLAGIGFRAFGVGDHAAMVVEQITDGSRADLILGEILGEAIQRDIRRGNAGDLAIGVERRGNCEPDQPQGREDVGVGDQQRFLLDGLPVPKSRPRIVARRLPQRPDLGFVGIEQRVMIDRRRPCGPVDPTVGVLDALRRHLVLDRDGRVDPPRLPERAVGRSDIHADDPVAMDQDIEQVFERSVGGIEIGPFVADRGRAANQRFDRIEHVLNVADRIGAEPLDEFIGVRAGDRTVRQVGDRDNREEDRHGQQQEQGKNARPQPRLFDEEASHTRAFAVPDGRLANRVAARPGAMEETKAIFKGSSDVPAWPGHVPLVALRRQRNLLPAARVFYGSVQ